LPRSHFLKNAPGQQIPFSAQGASKRNSVLWFFDQKEKERTSSRHFFWSGKEVRLVRAKRKRFLGVGYMDIVTKQAVFSTDRPHTFAEAVEIKETLEK